MKTKKRIAVVQPEIKVTAYGNVDIRCGIPTGWIHLSQDEYGNLRPQSICKAVGCRGVPALAGFEKAWRGYKPYIDGIVIPASFQRKVKAEIKKRLARKDAVQEKTEERREKRRQARIQQYKLEIQQHKLEINRIVGVMLKRFPGMPPHEAKDITEHGWEMGGGRVGSVSEMDDEEKIRRAVVAHVRHKYTEYDVLLAKGYEKPDAREEVCEQIGEIITRWQCPQGSPLQPDHRNGNNDAKNDNREIA